MSHAEPQSSRRESNYPASALSAPRREKKSGWQTKTLDQISSNLDSRRVPITNGVREGGEYPYYGASGLVDYVADYIFNEDTLLISEDRANLLARSTPIAFPASGKYWVNNHAPTGRNRNENDPIWRVLLNQRGNTEVGKVT